MPDRPREEIEALVGETRTTAEGFAVEVGAVEAFARALGEPDPVFRDPAVAGDRGADRVPAPPTFARARLFPRYVPGGEGAVPTYGLGVGFDLGFDPARVLHGEQSYQYERPLRVGDVLDAATTLADLSFPTGRRGGEMAVATFETVYRTREGERVLSERETVIETAAVDGPDADTAPAEAEGEAGGDAAGEGPDADDRTPLAGRGALALAADESADGRRRPAVTAAGSVAVGDALPAVETPPLSRRDFVRYAGASGDFNPVHYDDAAARAAGQPAAFAQGMLTAGVGARAATDWVGVGRLARLSVRFEAPVFQGDALRAGGEVTDVARDGDRAEATAALTVERDDGSVVLSGEVVADLPGKA